MPDEFVPKNDLNLMKLVQNRIQAENHNHEFKMTPQIKSLTDSIFNHWIFRYGNILANLPGIIGSIMSGLGIMVTIFGCVFVGICSVKKYVKKKITPISEVINLLPL